MKDYRVETDA